MTTDHRPPTTDRRRVKIAPSILAADYTRLGEQVRAAAEAGAGYIHCDVMDGHFVPPITFGALIVAAVRRVTTLPLDVHMMVEQPERYVDAIAHAGGSIFTAHIEATQHIHRVVQSVKAAGMRAGVAINPGTPAGVLEAILPDVDLVLVMSVNPGWGGQPFLAEVLAKVRQIRTTIDALGLNTEVEIDGGITKETAALAVKAGADVLVAGTAVFNEGEPITAALTRLQHAVENAAPA